MNFPCVNKLDCECESPLSNLSAEEPDRITYYSEKDDGGEAGWEYRLGYDWECDRCHVICASDVSQQEADDCADRMARECVWQCLSPPTPQLFRSNEQTCSHYCADTGETVYFTLPTGYTTGLTQQEADQKAYNYACDLAALLCYSVPSGIYPNTPQVCSVTCDDGSTQSYTVAANSFWSTTQAQADAEAYQFACVIAQTLCPPPPFFVNSEQTCTFPCPDGSTQTRTVPANIFSGRTQADADAAAYAYACWLASLMCRSPDPIPEPPPPVVPTSYRSKAMTITLTCPAGGLMAYNVPEGLVVALSQSEADSQAYSLGLQRANSVLFCLDKNNIGLCLNSGAGDYLNIIGGSGPFNWSFSGLPAGVTTFPQDAQSRQMRFSLSGLPLTVGTYSFYVSITDYEGHVMNQWVTLYVAQIMDVTLPAGVICVPYSHQLTVNAPVGLGTPVWIIYSGTLPHGLIMSTSGLISGEPTTCRPHPFRVQVSIA